MQILSGIWYSNGGKVTHDHFKHCTNAYRSETLEYIRNLPINIEISVDGIDYLLVHGAPACLFAPSDRYANEMEFAVWTRLGRNAPMFEDKIVIFGHKPS